MSVFSQTPVSFCDPALTFEQSPSLPWKTGLLSPSSRPSASTVIVLLQHVLYYVSMYSIIVLMY